MTHSNRVQTLRHINRKRKITRYSSFIQKSCLRKNVYISMRSAMSIAAKSRLERPGAELRVYDCSHCGHWHITHKTQEHI